MPSRCRASTVALFIVGGISAMSSGALAHIDPDPSEAPAGSEQSVGFTVEHGCEGSPTVELLMRLPEGISTAAPEAPDGWTGSVADNVVTFSGGPLAADVAETFRVRVVLPTAPGTTIYFPFVQRCQVGEIAWIDIPRDDSGTELDEPAPAMLLTAPLPGAVVDPTTTTAVATTTTAAPSPSTIVATSTTAAPAAAEQSTTMALATTTTAAPTTAVEANHDDTGNGGEIVFYIMIAVVVVGGAIVLLRARRRR